MKQITSLDLLRSLGRRVTAVGFIVLILLGNYWATLTIPGGEISVWLYEGALCGLGLVLIGGALMLAAVIRNYLTTNNDL